MVGGQVGLRLSLGDHGNGSLFFEADFRFGALRNAISRVVSDTSLNGEEATDAARAMMFGSDVTLGLQLNETVALTFGLRYLQIRGVDLATDFLSEVDADQDDLYLIPPNLVPFSVHGATLGLTLAF